jgi:nitroimidazol reductase NimA-like FMN-containing flavoprotein (pyridoxamine 5'-phosphate oxidase superfamily)
VTDVFDLDEQTCRDLLSAGLVGRVAASTPTGPHVVPVNFVVVDDAIVLQTTPYSVLGSLPAGTLLALEVDTFDYERHHGWSVVARGRSEIVHEARELEHIRRTWPLRTWAGGARNLTVRIRWTELTGRQLGRGWEPLAELPVRRVTSA